MKSDPRLDLRFCPKCGSERIEPRRPPVDDRPRPTCLVCGYVHYVGPALAAGAILHDGERLCLVRRALEPGKGRWTFPGGFVDLDEEPRAAALRETAEETGCQAEVERVCGAYTSLGPRNKRVVILVYVARLLARGVAEPAGCLEEVQEVRWFLPAALPWEELAFASTRQALRDYLGGGIRPPDRD